MFLLPDVKPWIVTERHITSRARRCSLLGVTVTWLCSMIRSDAAVLCVARIAYNSGLQSVLLHST